MPDAPLMTTWTPPQAKTTSAVVKYIAIGVAVIGGVYLWNGFAPSLVDAVGLLDELLTDSTKALEAAAGLLVALWLFYEVFSKNGHINKLLQVYYWHLINSLTRQIITIDPLSPIDERIKSLQADQATFEQNFERVDGLIGSIKNKQSDYVQKAHDVAARGQAAARLGKTSVQQACAHDYGEFTKAAQDYDQMRQHLEPLSATLKQVSEACADTIHKLTVERSILKDKWGMQDAIHGAVDSASRVLGKSRDQVWDMADQAEDVITSKYGEALGNLEHLKNYAEPLMESIDLDKATYNDAMLAAVNKSGAQMLQSTAATPLPLSGAAYQAPADQSASVSSFLQ